MSSTRSVVATMSLLLVVYTYAIVSSRLQSGQIVSRSAPSERHADSKSEERLSTAPLESKPSSNLMRDQDGEQSVKMNQSTLAEATATPDHPTELQGRIEKTKTSLQIGPWSTNVIPPFLDGTPFSHISAISDLPDPLVNFSWKSGACDVAALAHVQTYSYQQARWVLSENASKWCSDEKRNDGFPGLRHIGEREYLLSKFTGKTVLFLGDSIVRNHFVLVAARLCNPKNFDRCNERMPTPPFGLADNHWKKGPWGCIPKDDPDYDDSTAPKTACYTKSKFNQVPIPGLTMRDWPRNRVERAKQLKMGWIFPAMVMEIPKDEKNTTSGNITLMYLGITTPKQISRVARYIASRRERGMLWPEAVFVSIGPHLSLSSMGQTPHSIPWGLAELRNAFGDKNVPIALSEMTQTATLNQDYDKFQDALCKSMYFSLLKFNISVVPVRHLARHRRVNAGFGWLPRWDREEKEAASRVLTAQESGKIPTIEDLSHQCGYYDTQHPALRCHLAANNLMLAAVLPKMKDSEFYT